MTSMTAKKILGRTILRHALSYAARDPEKNLLRVIKWGERLAIEEEHRRAARIIMAALADPKNNWTRLVRTQLRRLAPRVREKMVINFFLNAALLGIAKGRALEKAHGVHIPWVMLIDPTGRCNLRCKGCWAGEYDRSKDMDFATLDRVLGEAEELGIHFIVVSGGEPTLRMDDLTALARKHEDSVFHVFTNGTLIDEKTAAATAELGNITFAISLEGLEESTDARRGRGVFARVMRAMDHLRAAGVLFGFSATYTRENAEEIGSDRFIDLMVEKGCAYGWLFTYVPVGGNADLAYMATPEQRAAMYRTVQRWREEKPIFVADFWNDGEAVEGCIAGGRCYFHINAMGDVEPCAFVHYANVNIKETTLFEALQCPLFKAYQARQPFAHNHLRPCPIIDHPWMLEEIVRESGAYSTQKNDLAAPQLCQPLYGYAESWRAVADELWAERQDRPEGKAVDPRTA